MPLTAAQRLTAPCLDLLDAVDYFRVDAARRAITPVKERLGQFFTVSPVAKFMASLLTATDSTISLLDAGAGVGSLFAAAVNELALRPDHPKRIEITAFEVDDSLGEYLSDTMRLCEFKCRETSIDFAGRFETTDFLEWAAVQTTGDLFSNLVHSRFNCAILNPPYFKINVGSSTHALLARMGVQSTNIYTGFLSATVQLLVPGGELVAITPRSFCNGPYFKEFRHFFLRHMTIKRIHVFESRQQAFSDDGVLQENIILHAVKGASREPLVTISVSKGPEDSLASQRVVERDQVVRPDDPEAFIHIPCDELSEKVTDQMRQFSATLDDLGISVSTGRVVDFRAAHYLRLQPETGTVPLIYPAHFRNGVITWPKENTKKPNAIVDCPATADLLVPTDTYVLVKRFSAKEERRRIVAAVFEPTSVASQTVGFENHLNYFHDNGAGLNIDLARGLAGFLNSTLVDQYFRQFSGHTQVNATDLRNLHYPSSMKLIALGQKMDAVRPEQHDLDQLVHKELLKMADGENVDPIFVAKRIQEALHVLTDLGLPQAQLNERSALALLALLDLKPTDKWSKAMAPLRGITPLMDFFATHYGKKYAPNSRETVRRFTVHQFLDAGIVVANPDNLSRPTNSPRAVYQIESSVLDLLRAYGTKTWKKRLRTYLTSVETLQKRYAQEREMTRIPIRIAEGVSISLSPGGQNVLIQKIIEEFAPRFTPGGKLLYVGDTDEKFAYFDDVAMQGLGVNIEAHGKMPDVIIHHADKNWLVLIEAVTSHGPINPKRQSELKKLFRDVTAGLVFVTAFLDRKAMVQYLIDISWETEVWVAESPSHLIHFNGERFLGPY